MRIILFLLAFVASVYLSVESFGQAPTATLSGTQSVCLTVPSKLTVSFTGTPPWNFSYFEGSNLITVSSITQNPYILIVNPPINTFTPDPALGKLVANYIIASVSNNNFSSGNVNGSAKLILNPSTTQGSEIPLSLTGPNPIYCPSGNTVLTTTSGFTYYKWLKNGVEISNDYSNLL